jgi:hypothetical protein
MCTSIMLAAITPDAFDSTKVLVSPRADNNVVHGTYFHRCQYAQLSVLLTAVYVCFSLAGARCSGSHGNARIEFDTDANARLIEELSEIESLVLDAAGLGETRRAAGLRQALESGVLKNAGWPRGVDIHPPTVILRISGVWEDSINHGLVYRFIVPTRPL